MFGIFILKMLGSNINYMFLWEDVSHLTSTANNSHLQILREAHSVQRPAKNRICRERKIKNRSILVVAIPKLLAMEAKTKKKYNKINSLNQYIYIILIFIK